jgi:hypothetical protein
MFFYVKKAKSRGTGLETMQIMCIKRPHGLHDDLMEGREAASQAVKDSLYHLYSP